VPKTPEGRPTARTVVHSEQEIDDKIEAIEKKFKWDDGKTAELVKQLLRGAQPQFRKDALENMTESIKTNLRKQVTGR
jgi:predicted transcriptional regulator